MHVCACQSINSIICVKNICHPIKNRRKGGKEEKEKKQEEGNGLNMVTVVDGSCLIFD